MVSSPVPVGQRKYTPILNSLEFCSPFAVENVTILNDNKILGGAHGDTGVDAISACLARDCHGRDVNISIR